MTENNSVKYPQVNDLWVNRPEFFNHYFYCYILKVYGDYISYLELTTYGHLEIKHRVDKHAFIKHSKFVENRDMSIYDLFGLKEGEYDKNHKMIQEKVENNYGKY